MSKEFARPAALMKTNPGVATVNLPHKKISLENSKKEQNERRGRTLKKSQKHNKNRKQKINFARDDEVEIRVRLLEMEMTAMELEMDIHRKMMDIQSHNENSDEGAAVVDRDESHRVDDETKEDNDETSNDNRPADEEEIDNNAPSRDKINNKFEVDEFNMAITNTRGLASRSLTLSNIINKFDIRAVVVSETYCCGKEIPYINDNMTAFFDNRGAGPNKGGIAVFLENTLAKESVIIGKGASENEWVAVKCSYFSPPVVIIGVYGTNSGKPKEVLENTWAELWDFASSYAMENTVLVAGDLNCAVGKNFKMTNNDPSMNMNGKILKKILLDKTRGRSWQVLNNKIKGDMRSHVSSSGGVNRCLDYIIASDPSGLVRIHQDNDYQMTPYRVTRHSSTDKKSDNKDGNDNKSFTDHKTILATFKLDKRSSVVIKNPPPVIVRDEAGDIKFYELSEAVADYAIDQLNAGTSPEVVLRCVLKKIKDCEFHSYLRITRTKIRRKMMSDAEVFMKLTKDLEKQQKDLSKLKPNDQIFKVRGTHLNKQRAEEAFSMFNEQGELVEDRDGIIEILTAYNEKLLSREPHPEEFGDIHRFKKETVELLAQTKIPEYNTLTPEEYLRAIQKIQTKGKNMFKTFLKLSFKLQAVFFFIFKAMYEQETVASEMLETLLIPLYKKNDQRDPKNYRYLHIKMDVARIFELLVYMKLERHFDTMTSDSQQGGMKQGDTIENLAMLSSIIVDKEDKGEGVILTAVDAIKCFDRVHLSDSHAVLQTTGGDRKALKVLYKMGETNKIKVAGGKRVVEVKNGETQGGISAARRTTFMIDECTLRHAKKIPRELRSIHRGEEVDNEGFVDDELLVAFVIAAAAMGSALYTLTMDELAMSAHPEKTIQIVAGDETWVRKMRAELDINPCKMQNFQIKVKDEEKYLGMIFMSGKYSSTIDKNISEKVKKMKVAALGIRAVCNVPGIKRIGKMRAQKLLIMSQISPICLYGMQAWMRVSDSQYDQLERGFKEAIVIVLSVPIKTNYEALLRQINNFHIRNFSDAIKLKCWNKKLHTKKRGKIVRVLQYEIANSIKTGLAGELEVTCARYGLPNLCLTPLDPRCIDFYVKRDSYLRQWRKHLDLKTIPDYDHPGKAPNWHHLYPVNEARAYQAYELGLLIFKDSKEFMFPPKHKGNRICLNVPCQDLDSLSHSFECEYVKTKYMDTGDDVADLSRYLVALNMERITNHGVELIRFADGDNVITDEVLDYKFIAQSNGTSDRDIANIILKNWNIRKNGQSDVKFTTSSTTVKVPRLDELAAKACLDTSHADEPGTVPESVANFLTLSVDTNRAQVKSITDLLVGGRSQSLFRHQDNKKKISKAFSSLFTTGESKLRNMKKMSYTFASPARDQSYKEVIDSISTDTFVRRGLSITHIRQSMKTTIKGGREDIILQTKTSEDGTRHQKESIIRYTFVREVSVNVDAETKIETDDGSEPGPSRQGMKRKHSDEDSDDTTDSDDAPSSDVILEWENSQGEPARDVGTQFGENQLNVSEINLEISQPDELLSD